MICKAMKKILNISDVQKTWLVFALFALTIFVKCVLFHWFCFQSILISALWKAPLQFMLFYLPKLAPAIVIASFVLISKKRWWTVVVSVLLDTWMLANLIYVRANETFLNLDAIGMAGNMHGFWGSVETYFNKAYLLFYVITIVYALCLILLRNKENRRLWRAFGITIAIGLLLHLAGHINEYRNSPSEDSADATDKQFVQLNENERDKHIDSFRSWRQFIPFRVVYWHAKAYTDIWVEGYIRDHSIVQYAAAVVIYQICRPHSERFDVEDICVPLWMYDEKGGEQIEPKTNLIIILVESLEDWVFDNPGYDIAPNMSSLLHQDNVLYCHKLKSQVKQGTSGDGQMILNTGLLPTNVGAACMIYGDNEYPNFGHFYQSSYIFNPSAGAWNQKKATENYGYKELIQREDDRWEDDAVTFDNLNRAVAETRTNICAMAITIASHTPFKMVDMHPSLENIQANKYLKQYMSCMHYTDSCMGRLIESIKTDPVLKHSTIVITGDHTIFKPAMLREFRKQKSEIMVPEEAYVPLIIYSPNIEGNVEITDMCYQMDIYPTIMHLIGCEEYPWKGVGANLLDAEARNNRLISEEDAFGLSDKLIRSNWFDQEKKKGPSKDENQHYIAHAGGTIEGYKYTNSLEAIEHAIENGVQYIEVDFEWTADSQLVATHEWMGGDWQEVPTYEEFMGHKVYDRFIPMDVRMVDSIFRSNENLYLVTDKISDPVTIDMYFHDYRERVWVECFSEEDYFVLKAMGYNVWRSKTPPTNMGVVHRTIKRRSLNDFRIKNYVFRDTTVTNYGKMYGDCYAIYSAKDISKADADSIFELDKRIRFVYVDEME